jgi:hypothetical protein
MIIYEGKGYLIPIIVFLSALFTELISEEIMGDKLFYQESTYALPIALFIEKTGKRIEEKEQKVTHTLFYIPFQYWDIILGIIGTLTLFTKVQ